MSESDDLRVQIRPARKEDMHAVAEMIQELADSEKMPDGPKLTVRDLQRDGFETEPASFRCVVGEAEGGEVAGYALYFPTYSTWRGRALLLEDLYVRAARRRRGLGRRLFAAVAKEALSTGCSRLDFHVLQWNPARRFYEGLGAANLSQDEEWCLYRLTGDALRAVGDAGNSD